MPSFILPTKSSSLDDESNITKVYNYADQHGISNDTSTVASPFDSEPDYEVDAERPGSSRNRRKRFAKRPFLMKNRKNQGNTDYASLIPSSQARPTSRGCKIIQGTILIVLALALTVAIHPLLEDTGRNVIKGVRGGNSTKVTPNVFSSDDGIGDPAAGAVVDNGGSSVAVNHPITQQSSPAPVPKPKQQQEDQVDQSGYIRPGPLMPHHSDDENSSSTSTSTTTTTDNDSTNQNDGSTVAATTKSPTQKPTVEVMTEEPTSMSPTSADPTEAPTFKRVGPGRTYHNNYNNADSPNDNDTSSNGTYNTNTETNSNTQANNATNTDTDTNTNTYTDTYTNDETSTKSTTPKPTPAPINYIKATESPTTLSQTNANGSHNGEGPETNISTLQRRCSAGYQTPHERSQATLLQYTKAQDAGFGYCGPENEHPTSLTQTALGFSHMHPTYGDSGDGWMWLDPAKKAVGVRHVSLPFRAVTANGTPRTIGGDEFVLTFMGWTTPSKALEYGVVVVKTAVIAEDMGDGSYNAFLAVPDVPFAKVKLTLAHYYGCYQGYFAGKWKNSEDYLNLDVGPMEVAGHEEFNNLVLVEGRKEDYGWWSEDLPEKTEGLDRRWVSVPECGPSQMGMDGLTNGLWAEFAKPGDQVTEISTSAVWSPLCCRTQSKDSLLSYAGKEPLRIGDGTMPHPTIEVGDVYDVLKPFHNKWIDYLVDLHNKYSVNGETTGSDDVMVFNAGLNFIQSGYNPETAANLVTRMLCQITLFYPGKVLWTGSVPIQQQLDSSIDITDQNLRLVDAKLRQLVEGAGNRLDDICDNSNVANLYGFVNTKNGSSRIKAYATHQFKKLNQADGNGDLAHSENFLKIDHVVQRMSEKDMKSLWGDRKVVYADIDHFLRPRPETYNANDKIHNVRPGTDGSSLFEGEHDKLFMNMIQMRRGDSEL